MEHFVNENFPGALIGLIAIGALWLLTRRPVPPPGTPWPDSHPRHLRLRHGRHRSRPPIIIDAEIIDEMNRVDEETAAALRQMSMRAHPSYRPPVRPVPELPPREDP